MPDSPRTGPTPSLAAAAPAALQRGDLAGYRALFADAARLPGRNERYAARCDLLRAALEQPPPAAAAWVAAAHEAVALLEDEPCEPVLLNQAGVLLGRIGCLGAAAALFEAAQRLDPALSNVARNLEQARRSGPASTRADGLAELATRAGRAARRARPAEGMTVSLCMIVKDEEEMLPRCLAAAAPAVDEIVVVDTGSSDRTVEIARSYGARVIERAWTGSFSEARNVGLDAARSDWLLVLDADEVLAADDAPALRSLLGQTWREAFYVSEINYTGDLDDGTATTHSALRLFRNRSEHRYAGRLHEQIIDALPARLPERFGTSSVRIEHFGYLGAVRDAKEKSRRNIELLERQRADGDDSAFLHFNLGSEHAAAGDAERALAAFERAAERLEAGGEQPAGYLAPLTSRHVRALRQCGRDEEAIARAEQALERLPGFTDLVFEQGLASQALGRVDDAVACFERCLELGDAPARYTATVGSGTYLPTIALADVCRQRGDAAGAVALLEPCLAAHPGFYGLVLPLAAALLAAGERPEDVVARVEERVARLTPTVRFMLGTALYEHGETAAAEAQYRHVLEQQPSSGHARVALAEALLSQRRWAEAASVAAALADPEPHAAAARRSELFAQLVGGDLDGAAATLARLARAGDVLPADELALFAAWLGAARGAADAALLPDGAVPLLATTLEALLRVEEVDAFALAVPLLGRCGIAPRERRELLAGMYLRRGYLASAAEEWIAACDEGQPDVRALLGLAQVAVGQGMRDEALDFAREAHALDPEDSRAARLLQQLEPLPA